MVGTSEGGKGRGSRGERGGGTRAMGGRDGYDGRWHGGGGGVQRTKRNNQIMLVTCGGK